MATSEAFRRALFDGDINAMKASVIDFTNIDKSYEGWTALIHVSTRGYPQLIPFLVERGANVNAVTQIGNTSLHLAAQNGSVRCIHALLKYGANLEFRNNSNWTPFECAIRTSEAESIQVLLDYGAKVPDISPAFLPMWPHSIISKRTALKRTSLVFLALAKRTRVLSRDMRFIISSLLWATRNDNVWLI
jgi:ankyrin repeat protein